MVNLFVFMYLIYISYCLRFSALISLLFVMILFNYTLYSSYSNNKLLYYSVHKSVSLPCVILQYKDRFIYFICTELLSILLLTVRLFSLAYVRVYTGSYC